MKNFQAYRLYIGTKKRNRDAVIQHLDKYLDSYTILSGTERYERMNRENLVIDIPAITEFAGAKLARELCSILNTPSILVIRLSDSASYVRGR